MPSLFQMRPHAVPKELNLFGQENMPTLMITLKRMKKLKLRVFLMKVHISMKKKNSRIII